MTLDMDEIVALSTVALTVLLVVVVPPGNLEVFAILVLIGVLVVRALAGPYASVATNTRVDGFIAAGLVAFAVIVLDRVFEVLAG